MAVIDDTGVIFGPVGIGAVGGVIDVIATLRPDIVAVDAPRALARAGARMRMCELAFVRRRICGIRPTPDRERLDASPRYYEWIENGLALFAALAAAGVNAIECFPTAAWTIWARPRGTASRARWSAAALAGCRVAGVPARLGQDGRDSIGAALVARAFASGRCESVGDIVLPLATRP